ncbi:MAG: HAMP domain-containing histidine kinase [Bacteroidales bacterium]|nr:HAMP domain-containing histidine kinase [Bacteroidales bacterium]
MSNNENAIQVLIIDSEVSISEYKKILKDVTQCHFLYSENYLQYANLIKQKRVDVILINVKYLSEQQPKELNNIKKQFKDFGIPTFFFRLKSGQEIIIDSILNTSIVPPDSLLISDLILKTINHDVNEETIDDLPLKQKNRKEDKISNIADSNEVNQQKAIFIRNITYEIRTLLNNISAPVQLIKEKVDDPELVPFFGIIDTTLSKLVEFTFKATLSSDLKLGNYPIRKTFLNLDEIVRFSVLELTEFLELEKIKLVVNTPESKVSLYGDKDLLFHGFNAILDKIINITKENGEIQIDFSSDSEKIDCKIFSNNISYPKQDILEIFNSISIEQEIGLALAKNVLSIHQGSYWVDLTKETGITIGISFKINDYE